jgi:hypothetical protein
MKDKVCRRCRFYCNAERGDKGTCASRGRIVVEGGLSAVECAEFEDAPCRACGITRHNGRCIPCEDWERECGEPARRARDEERMLEGMRERNEY